MLKRKMTILLIGAMFFGPVGGFLSVICRGSDGHIAVEPVVHDHCECSEAGDGERPAGATTELSGQHGHCRDSIATSNAIAPAGKKVKRSIEKIATAEVFHKANAVDASSGFSLTTNSNDVSSFHGPLRTIILLV